MRVLVSAQLEIGLRGSLRRRLPNDLLERALQHLLEFSLRIEGVRMIDSE